jgi:hypothetical protein
MSIANIDGAEGAALITAQLILARLGSILFQSTGVPDVSHSALLHLLSRGTNCIATRSHYFLVSFPSLTRQCYGLLGSSTVVARSI